jgi:hypothetical protein
MNRIMQCYLHGSYLHSAPSLLIELVYTHRNTNIFMFLSDQLHTQVVAVEPLKLY